MWWPFKRKPKLIEEPNAVSCGPYRDNANPNPPKIIGGALVYGPSPKPGDVFMWAYKNQEWQWVSSKPTHIVSANGRMHYTYNPVEYGDKE